MKLPISWLKDYVDLDIHKGNIKDFMEAMTLSGSKVEGVERLGEEITGVVVGKVEEILPHPNADKLVITKINVGRGDTLQIVTGAQNLFQGAYVPVALDGATLANGVVIQKGKLRGADSEGMLCSIEELGYNRNDYPEAPEDGIYIFPEAHTLGESIDAILEIKEDVVEFEITSNRPDCFSILGLAREAAATYHKALRYPEVSVKEEGEGDTSSLIDVEIQNPHLCPRYIARVIKNVTIGPSPQWMRHRLTASGIRPINNIVDITNYVMLELGQPMHAFDIDCIVGGKIIVRNALDGESLTTLDGEERKLDASMLVIADKDKAVALGGIMGGENSKITGEAGAVLFEAAAFDGTNIRVSSKKVGLRTDSSSKFEKGLDPNLPLAAINRAAQLVEILGCGQVVPGMVDKYPSKREKWTISYQTAYINNLIGINLAPGDMEDYLKRVEVDARDGVATIPTFRPDLEAPEDLAEEVARLYGYGKIPSTLAAGTPTVGGQSRAQMLTGAIKGVMVSLGYCEALTYAFESPRVFDKLLIKEASSLRNTVKINNPLGEDYSIMRTTTINGLLASLAGNYNKRNPSAALFEIAKTYIPQSLPLAELPEEVSVLTWGSYGMGGFYEAKGDMEYLLASLGIDAETVDFQPEKHLPFMHPGRTAQLIINGEETGFVGEIHPGVLENYEIGVKAYGVVLKMDTLLKNARTVRPYQPIPKFPAIRRDISLTVDDGVPSGHMEKAIRQTGGKLLEKVSLFDVYKGAGLLPGKKSLAYEISFRASDRTLTDEEVGVAMEKIVACLEKEFSARLRDK